MDGAFRGTDREAVEMVRAGRGRRAGQRGAAWAARVEPEPRPAAPPPAQAQYLLRNEGLFVGSSAAMNCVGAVKVARALGPGHTIVTVLCDGGHRHLSKFHSPAYLEQHGLTPAATGRALDFVA